MGSGRRYNFKMEYADISGNDGNHLSGDYATFVKRLYDQNAGSRDITSTLSFFHDNEYNPTISAGAQLKADMLLDKQDVRLPQKPSKLLAESVEQTKRYMGDDFQVYQPKAYRNYFPTAATNRQYVSQVGDSRAKYGQDLNRRMDTESRKPIVVDYKSFDSPPLSPYFYTNHKSMNNEDSRIIGSEFVMLNLRRNENFLHKVDETLAKAREINSWS